MEACAKSAGVRGEPTEKEAKNKSNIVSIITLCVTITAKSKEDRLI